MIQELQNEKAEIEKKISHNEQLIIDTQNQIYLLKKRQKLIESFMKKADELEKEEMNQPTSDPQQNH